MEKIHFPRKFRVYLPLIILYVVLVFLLPKTSKFNYDYKKGEPWAYETLTAQFDFPILKTEQQLLQEYKKVSSSVIPYYRHDSAVELRSQQKLQTLDMGEYSGVKSRISSVLSDIYSKGVISSAGHDTSNVDKSSALIYVQQDMKAHKIPVSEVYTVSVAEDALLAALASEYKASEADSVYNAAGLRNLIAPDLILDQQTTEMMHRETLENISMTSGVFRTGQVIVNYGEVVTAEIMQLLDSYKYEFEASVGYDGNVVFQWIGCGLIALFMVFMVFVAI